MERSSFTVAALFCLLACRCAVRSDLAGGDIKFEQLEYNTTRSSVVVMVIGHSLSGDVNLTVSYISSDENKLVIGGQNFTLFSDSLSHNLTLSRPRSPTLTPCTNVSFTLSLSLARPVDVGGGGGSGDFDSLTTPTLGNNATVIFICEFFITSSLIVPSSSSPSSVLYPVVTSIYISTPVVMTTVSMMSSSLVEPTTSTVGIDFTTSSEMISLETTPVMTSLKMTSPAMTSLAMTPPAVTSPAMTSLEMTSSVILLMQSSSIGSEVPSLTLQSSITDILFTTSIEDPTQTTTTTTLSTTTTTLPTTLSTTRMITTMSTRIETTTDSSLVDITILPSFTSFTAVAPSSSSDTLSLPVATTTEPHSPVSLPIATEAPSQTLTPTSPERPTQSSQSGVILAVVFAVVIIMLILIIVVVAMVIALVMIRKKKRTHTYYTAGVGGNKFNHYIDVQVRTEEEMREKTPDSKDFAVFETSFVAKGPTPVVNEPRHTSVTFKGELAAVLRARSQKVDTTVSNGDHTPNNNNLRDREE